MKHRYLTEDIPFGLVPMASIGAATGVKTPTIGAMISLSNMALGRDLKAEGLNTEKLGLEGMTVKQMQEYARRGSNP